MSIVIRKMACGLSPAVFALLMHSGAALAQDRAYPNRPIRIIVAVAPGAGGDTIARAVGQIAQRLAADGSQPAERMTPEEFKAAMAREYVEIEQQVKRLNIKIL